MTKRLRRTPGFLLLALGVAACVDNAGAPTAPTPPQTQTQLQSLPPVQNSQQLVVFRDAQSGASTTDARDSDEQIIQFTASGELIWTLDGTRLPGYRVSPFMYPGAAFIEGSICPDRCGFEVRFGTLDCERRAYLTLNYGHWNEGMIADVEVRDGALQVKPSQRFPPGTFTLTGQVTELTSAGLIPVAGAMVDRLMSDGWQGAKTDAAGMYTIYGMYNGTRAVSVRKNGYQPNETQVAISGDTHFDAQLVRH